MANNSEYHPLKQKYAIEALRKYLEKYKDVTVVPEDLATSILYNGRTYQIRGGDRFWLKVGTTEEFFVTLEHERTQLSFVRLQGRNGEFKISRRSLGVSLHRQPAPISSRRES